MSLVIPRVLGGTIILGTSTTTAATIIVTGRDGQQTAVGRDGKQIAAARDGSTVMKGA